MNEEIVIVGGGFAGFWASLAAKRVAGQRATVTLVSRESTLQMRPRLYEARPETLGVDLVPLLRSVGVRFVQGDAIGLDLRQRRLDLSSGEQLSFARLVVATGSAMRRPPIPGADEAHAIDTQPEAIAFDQRLAEIARTTRDPTVVIVGAGFTGIELALEMRDRLAVHGGPALAERARIMLVDRAEEVGFELGPGPRHEVEAALAAARIEPFLGATVTSIGAGAVTLSQAPTLDVDTVVLATGMVAAGFVEHIPGQRDGLGRIAVDGSLRAPASPSVFVTGDAALADTGEGHMSLQSCQHALQLGRFAGENAARDLLGMATLSYAQPRYITCLDLGRSGAVLTEGWERAVRTVGAEAKALKQRINTRAIYPARGVPGDVLLALSSTEPAAQRLPQGEFAYAEAGTRHQMHHRSSQG